MSSGNNPTMSNQEDDVNSETEARILSQEDVNKQIQSYIAPLTKQLEDLTQLLQGLTSIQEPNFYQKAGTSANFSIADYQPDREPGCKNDRHPRTFCRPEQFEQFAVFSDEERTESIEIVVHFLTKAPKDKRCRNNLIFCVIIWKKL